MNSPEPFTVAAMLVAKEAAAGNEFAEALGLSLVERDAVERRMQLEHSWYRYLIGLDEEPEMWPAGVKITKGRLAGKTLTVVEAPS